MLSFLLTLLYCPLTWVNATENSTQSPTAYGDLRLVGGGATYGRVEIFYNNEWGTICDDGWDDHEAAIVCRQLGFSAGLAKKGGLYGQGTGQVWLTGLGCGQYDADLLYCVHNSIKENEGAPCGHERDAGVECNKEPAIGFLKRKVGVASIVILGSLVVLALMCRCYKICTDRGIHKIKHDAWCEGGTITRPLYQEGLYRHMYNTDAPREPNGEAIILNNLNAETEGLEPLPPEPGVLDGVTGATCREREASECLIVPANLEPPPPVPPPSYDVVFHQHEDRDDGLGDEAVRAFFSNAHTDDVIYT